MWCDTLTGKTTNGALLCSLVQIARVVIVRVIVDGVLGVTVDVHIGHDEVLVIYVAIFVVIFCNWRCTLYTMVTEDLVICCYQVTKFVSTRYGFAIASSARGPCNFGPFTDLAISVFREMSMNTVLTQILTSLCCRL